MANAVIRLQKDGNPKRQDTKAFYKYALLMQFNGKPVTEYLSACNAIREVLKDKKAAAEHPMVKNKLFTVATLEHAVSSGAGLGEIKWCRVHGFLKTEGEMPSGRSAVGPKPPDTADAKAAKPKAGPKPGKESKSAKPKEPAAPAPASAAKEAPAKAA